MAARSRATQRSSSFCPKRAPSESDSSQTSTLLHAIWTNTGLMTRREFIAFAGGSAAVAAGIGVVMLRKGGDTKIDPLVVNDLHSQLNETHIARLEKPGSMEDLFA